MSTPALIFQNGPQRRPDHFPLDRGLGTKQLVPDPPAPPIQCSHCSRTFWIGENLKDNGQHLCTELIWLHCSPLQVGGDWSPENLILRTCTLCPGLPSQKVVLMSLMELQLHYVLGHFGRSLRDLFYNQFPDCNFPMFCLHCAQWKVCGQWILNEENLVLQLGLIHKRLFYLLMNDPRDLSTTPLNVCPER